MTLAADDQWLIIGCGRMSAALLKGLVAKSERRRTIAVDPNIEQARRLLGASSKVELVGSLTEVGEYWPDLTLIATKPSIAPRVVREIMNQPAGCGLVVSIAAGVTTSLLSSLAPDARLIRAVPNIPSAVQAGVTVLYRGPGATVEDCRACEAMFQSVGSTYWVEDEAALNGATALSGSGPAYAAAFVEALTSAGLAVGLPADLAQGLAVDTLFGGAKYLRRTGDSPAMLKSAVRSPAGTTDAALRIFEANGALEHLCFKAIKAAHERAVSLSVEADEALADGSVGL